MMLSRCSVLGLPPLSLAGGSLGIGNQQRKFYWRIQQRDLHMTSSKLCWNPPIPRYKGKHIDPKFAELRRNKFLAEFEGRFIAPIPNYHLARELRQKDSERVMLEQMKRDGLLPGIHYNERPIDITSSQGIIEGYVPPENDGVKSALSKEGAKAKALRANMWKNTKLSVRKINKMEMDIGGFAPEYFSVDAVDIYVMANEALVDFNYVRLHELVTTHCFSKMTKGLQFKTLKWEKHEDIESPRLVHAAVNSIGPETNVFGQVTIRINCKQIIAIYDRFGRLTYGDPETPRNVLEYVVFEKRLSDSYGTWRMHGKIEPDWAQAKPPVRKTFRMPQFEEITEDDFIKTTEEVKKRKGSEVKDASAEEAGTDPEKQPGSV